MDLVNVNMIKNNLLPRLRGAQVGRMIDSESHTQVLSFVGERTCDARMHDSMRQAPSSYVDPIPSVYSNIMIC